MITKVVHGWRVGGLIAYLMGPGRAQEHVSPRVIASWDGRDSEWQPQSSGATPSTEFGPLIRALRAPAVAAGLEERSPEDRRGYVWHCSARVADGARVRFSDPRRFGLMARARRKAQGLRQEDVASATGVGRRDIEDMDAILDQFLAFIRDGRDEPVEELDFSELVRETLAPYNQNGERVRLCLEPIPPFPLRRVSTKRLLTNLVENALNHGGGDAVEVVASLAGDYNAPYVVLSVLDRGNGIDPAELDSIFNPFIRGDRARGGRGTGLGLAIVKRIAALHGGSVELRNRSGGGLEARVRLPLGLLLPRDAV